MGMLETLIALLQDYCDQRLIALTAQARTRMDRRWETYIGYTFTASPYDRVAWQQDMDERNRLQLLYLQAGGLWARLYHLTPEGKAEQAKWNTPPQNGTCPECCGIGEHETEWGTWPCGSCDGTFWYDKVLVEQGATK